MARKRRANAIASQRNRRKSKEGTEQPWVAHSDPLGLADVDPTPINSVFTLSGRRLPLSSPPVPTTRTPYLEDSPLPRYPSPTLENLAPRLPRPFLEESPIRWTRQPLFEDPSTPFRQHDEKAYWERPYASQLRTSPPPPDPSEPTDSPVRVQKVTRISMLIMNKIANVPISASFRYAKLGHYQALDAYGMWLVQVWPKLGLNIPVD